MLYSSLIGWCFRRISSQQYYSLRINKIQWFIWTECREQQSIQEHQHASHQSIQHQTRTSQKQKVNPDLWLVHIILNFSLIGQYSGRRMLVINTNIEAVTARMNIVMIAWCLPLIFLMRTRLLTSKYFLLFILIGLTNLWLVDRFIKVVGEDTSSTTINTNGKKTERPPHHQITRR